MTHFIFAYDTERGESEVVGGIRLPSCLEGCRSITALHKKHDVPATFFIVGETLEKNPGEYRRLLDDPLFEAASHTYSHKLILYHGVWGPPAPEEEVREEIRRSKEIVEKVFGTPCRGLRPAFGFLEENMKANPGVLRTIQEAGYEYVSSALWGPDYTLPAPLNQSFTYGDEGFPGLREFPGHGWHDNVLRGQLRAWGIERFRVLCFPPLLPDAIPRDAVATPEEEFAIYRYLIDLALRDRLAYVSFIMHPWALYLADPSMRVLDLTMDYVRSKGMATCTFAQLNDRLNKGEA